MILCIPPKRLLANARHAGAALVITLSMIVLVTVAVVAFFGSTISNRRVEFSRASRTRADILAESGGAYASALILAEITDAGLSTVTTVPPTTGVSIYEPKVNANAYPARFLSPAISASDTSFFNLIRQSVPNTGTASYNETNASAHSTLSPASNGHSLSASFWNAPRLLVGNGFTQTQPNQSPIQLPNWIYMSRANGVTSTPTNDTVGRFAYNIYHTGGLLNVNAAGLPAGVSSVPDLLASLKGYQSGADLTQLPPPVTTPATPALTQGDVNALAAFRFPDSPAASDYVHRMLAVFGNGLLTVQNTDPTPGSSGPFKQNMFVSRRDLIRYASSTATNFLPVLPYLTHFSRAVNAPTWRPASGTDNPDLANTRFTSTSTPSSITHYDDQGKTSTYPYKIGDPLVQRRFSLAKLAWLTYKGPSTTAFAAGVDANAAIQAAFGLKWNPAQERWDYVGPTGSTMLGAIEDLSTVAGEGREPNFFELLKAGILAGTLGGAPLGKFSTDAALVAMSLCPTDNNVYYGVKDLHILQIGANIIDSADADNYPTRIAMQFGGLAIEKAGIEDLPYFYALDSPVFIKSQYDAATVAQPYRFDEVHFTWVPELFCLHRAPAAANTLTPNIEVNITSGLLRSAGFAQNGSLNPGNNASSPIGGSNGKDISALPVIPVPATDFEKFRNGPQPVRDSAASNRLGNIASFVDSTIQDVLAFNMVNYQTEFPKTFPLHISSSPNSAVLEVTNVMIALRYKTPNGQMKTYSTLGGANELAATTGIDGRYKDDFTPPILKQATLDKSGLFNGGAAMVSTVNACYLHSWDPRTARYGPSYGGYHHFLAEKPRFDCNTGTVTELNSCLLYSFYPTPTTYDRGYFKYNSTTYTGSLPQVLAFQDADHTARQPDGSLGYSATSVGTNTANPYSDPSSNTYTPARPVVLQRPYKNVAELGYVFRDVPWQTLNLYNQDSGDAALLDLFSVADEPAVSAGRVFLGTPHQPVITALVSATPQEPDGTLPLSATDAAKVSAALESYIFSSGAPSSTFPGNAADFATIMSQSGIKTAGLSTIKSRREAISRAVAGTTQTRTWNLLVDVVAQTGRFPLQKTGAADFVVDGESHCWISVAIDRYTGKIIGQQIEKVNE